MADRLVVVITGTSSGFGYETARLLTSAGYRVFGTMRDIDGRNAAPASQLAALGVTPIEMDVTDDASVQRGAESIVAAAGRVDVLVNNAGTAYFGTTEAFSTQAFERQFATNVFGSFRISRALLPTMRQNGSGLVVFISSIAGRLVLPFTGVYTSSKWAIEGLAEALSYELRSFGVDVAIVEPGAYATHIGNVTVPPDDAQRLASYGAVANNLDKVGEAIVGLIAMPGGRRPLRVTVPADALVDKINAVTAPIQREALTSFGVASLAAPFPNLA
jgi:NAD(P)-dependent dehydrogenase (short-subunit alcohol dehydrogenase family)